MPPVQDKILNLINGISQQAQTLRLPTQGDTQENGFSDVSEGQSKRPPLEHLVFLDDTVFTDVTVHLINRDATERYVSVFGAFSGEQIRVFGLDGTEHTVTGSDSVGNTYLASVPDKSEDLRMLTVADTTFLTNTEQIVAAGSTSSSSNQNRGFFAILLAVNGVTYTCSVTDTSGTYTGSHTAPSSGAVSTATIAAALKTALDTALAASTLSYTVTRNNHVLDISTTGNFDIEVEDARGGTSLKAIKDQTNKISDLPLIARHGYKVEIAGDESTNFDNYFVEFQADAGSGLGQGQWTEAVGPSVVLGFDEDTMPQKMVRGSGGPSGITFTVSNITWDDRISGDANTNPDPTFVGQKIKDVFFFKNRLGFLADENAIMSENGSFFNFFRTTVRTTLDTDPIDAAAASNKVSILEYALPYDEQLLLFSEFSQFRLVGGDVLSNETVAINPLTEYPTSLLARPIPLGDNAYWSANNEDFSIVWEYFVQTDTLNKRAGDITAHVPRYVPKNVKKLTGSDRNDIICFLSDDEPNTIYVYQFFWSGDKKLQSSWHKWTYSSDITFLDIEFLDSDIICVYTDGANTHIGKIKTGPVKTRDISETVNIINDSGDTVGTKTVNFDIALDKKISDATLKATPPSPLAHPVVAPLYDSSSDITTISLPFQITANETVQVVTRSGNGSIASGVALTLSNVTDLGSPVTFPTHKIYVRGNHSSTLFMVGISYEHKYKFSEFYLREPSTQQNEGPVILEGDLIIQSLLIDYRNAGYFKIKVTPVGQASHLYDPYEYTFEGGYFDTVPYTYDGPNIDPNGQFHVMVAQRNQLVEIELINDSFMPATFLSAEWFGNFESKRRGS